MPSKSPAPEAANPGRHGINDRNVSGPPRPIAPSARLRRGKKARPALPPGLLDQPQYPSRDASLQSEQDYIMHAVGRGASTAHIETELGLSPGSLVGQLLADRTLLLRYCAALVERGESFDHRAQAILAATAQSGARDLEIRTYHNYANSLRCEAESARRLSEAYLRKATVAADREDVRAKAAFQRVWDKIMGAPGAFAPATSIEISATSSDPLEAAKEILPQLRGDLDQRRAGGEPALDTLTLADQIKRVERFIRRRENPATATTTDAPAPAWIAPQKGKAQAVMPCETNGRVAQPAPEPVNIVLNMKRSPKLSEAEQAARDEAKVEHDKLVGELKGRIAHMRACLRGIPLHAAGYVQLRDMEAELQQLEASMPKT